jgi:hypothetical protein
MGCIYSCGRNGNEVKKRTVALLFKRDNLDYSIENYAYIEADGLDESQAHLRHLLTDICQEGNRDRVTRILGVIHAEIIELLYPYTKQPVVEEEVTDDLWEPEVYRMELRVPESYSRTSVHLLTKLIHEYMVYRVLHDWLMMTWVEKAGYWEERADKCLKEIEHLLNTRTERVRIRLHPF